MRILVIGDSCRDVFVYGRVNRLCPEAPVPVFLPKRKSDAGGMAMNVYENITSLKIPTDIITNTEEVVKTRYVEETSNHIIMRVDTNDDAISRISNLRDIAFEAYTAVIISDYNKGFLTYEDIEYICNRHSNVFIDTKKRINDNMLGAKFIKINEDEYNANLAAGQDFKDFHDNLVVTLSSRGCRHKDRVYPVNKVDIKDISGAGDTFITALTVEYCRSGDIEKALVFANECATIVVQHKGVTKVGHYINIHNK